MELEFSKDKSHYDNTKTSIDKILNKETKVKRKRKSAEDIKRNLFISIINNIILLEERSLILDESFCVNLLKYEEPYKDLIEDFLDLTFSKEQVKLINFYLYDRHSADGKIVPLKDVEDNIVKLENTTDLWNLLKEDKL